MPAVFVLIVLLLVGCTENRARTDHSLKMALGLEVSIVANSPWSHYLQTGPVKRLLLMTE